MQSKTCQVDLWAFSPVILSHQVYSRHLKIRQKWDRKYQHIAHQQKSNILKWREREKKKKEIGKARTSTLRATKARPHLGVVGIEEASGEANEERIMVLRAHGGDRSWAGGQRGRWVLHGRLRRHHGQGCGAAVSGATQLHEEGLLALRHTCSRKTKTVREWL